MLSSCPEIFFIVRFFKFFYSQTCDKKSTNKQLHRHISHGTIISFLRHTYISISSDASHSADKSERKYNWHYADWKGLLYIDRRSIRRDQFNCRQTTQRSTDQLGRNWNIHNGHLFPKAKEVLMQDFYMDDLLSGANTELEALDIQSQISKLLKRGGFPIRKWTSNSCNIMN